MQRENKNVVITTEPAVQPEAEMGFVIGVDLGGTNLRLALADTSGMILTRWSSSTVGLREPEMVIERICGGVKHMLQEVSVSPDALRSIAIGVPGITDVDNGIVIATSYLMGWKDVPLRELIEKQMNVQVVIDNDVNMAAIGEQWTGSAKDATDFVFLAIGTGIGAGIVLNGRLYRGSSWAAGEIGYMLLPQASEIPHGKDEPGALERVIGGEGIKASWRKLLSAQNDRMPAEFNANATEIFDRALDGDSRAQTILHQTATLLAQAVYNMSLVLNCPLCILGGTVGLHPALCDVAQRALDQLTGPRCPRLVRSTLGTNAQLLGALRAALDSAPTRTRRG